MTNCCGDMAGLFCVKRAGGAFADSTEPTMPSANITAQHERRRAIRPAFEDVRTTRFLTDRMQIQALNQPEQVILIRRITQTNLQPFRFWLTRFGVEDLKFADQRLYLFRSSKHSNIRLSNSASNERAFALYCAALRLVHASPFGLRHWR